MTLNITLLTPTTIYQSADFRLTTGSDESTKTVVLQYPTWSGFVTYMGLGWLQGRNVSDFIADWLDDGVNRSMWEVAACLQSEGERLLADAGWTGSRHTFTLAGFEDGTVRAFVISNFENCYGKERSTVDYLTITWREFQTWSGAAVIVTGKKKAVPVTDRRNLRQLAMRNPEDGGSIRRRMKDLNALAAAKPESEGGISENCGVISFRFDGYGAFEWGDETGGRPADIPVIMNGVNIARFMAESMTKSGVDMSSARMTNATFVSTNDPGPKSRLQSSCRFQIWDTDSSSGYQIHEIRGSDFEPLAAHDINEVSHVVGTGREEQTVPWAKHIPWIMRDGEVSKLDYDGSAWGLNGDDFVAAMPNGENGEAAALYADGSIFVFPLYGPDVASVEATRSTGKAINADGIVAGSVCTQTGHNIRGAVFQESHPPIVLTEPAAEWGTHAVDINDRGQVLVQANFAPGVVRSILWNFEQNNWAFVGDDTTNVMPIAVTNEGVVLGVTTGSSSLAVICEPDGAWQQLGTSNGWSPKDVNEAGDIVGIVMHDSLFHPWLRMATGEQFLLPFIIGHHTEATAINNAGTVIGTAGADHGGHAVIWRRG